jgi:hypothetical protein
MVVRLHCTPTTRLAAQHRCTAAISPSAAARCLPQCHHKVSALIAFLHCDLVRKTLVAKLGVRLQIRAKSLYQLFEVIQFLKLLNRIIRLDVMYTEKYKKVVFSIFCIHYV